MMLDVLLLFSSICTAVVGGASQTITGYRGERVDIRCSYESGYESNSKYFCKGECIYKNRNIMVKSGSPAKDERFSLTDDTTARVFTVTITDLRTEDEGQYWCAVKRSITDVYSEILLLVKLVPPFSISVSISPSGVIVEGDSVTLNCISDSNPPAEIRWFKGGTFVGSGRIFNISKISSDDSGEYKCKSINEHGEKYSDAVTLNVMCELMMVQ
ncbi:B-cell receptor CD22-like [Rhinichthys klamathensis goyatoka]|uniref:B-cell receptor CD22-like n=1 Tax=Rhinichthys klamathensis goyatoka TaxID=3034132 RepID=UPI0024B5DBDB|nr:B-cell receptor CD22-like [Rhinichthys klamathensis goyatoka]